MIKLFTLIFSIFANEPIKVATHYSPPWSNGDCTGAEIDIIRESFRQEGEEIECHYYSYGRLVKNFKSKITDFATPITRIDGDNSQAYYSEPFHKYSDVVISLYNKKISLKDFKDKRILAYQGASNYLGPEFQKVIKQAKSYIETSDREGQIESLQKKRVDYIVGEVNLLHYLSQKVKPKVKVYTNLTIKKWDIRSASHKKNLMLKFNRGLNKLIKNGTVDKIYQQYHIIK
ncbi:ABC transporter substrate-binding protein [Bacteriovorax sp. Seq25_V]|uniref:substrate-binding periplasmic protein n=1 Tax=Bacteriovorax sp. Seq25_V TaxID=1201288 RepID=UPI000389EA82|nr:transporter substrate-binding domain-containing protein [Bacteriovorax sp. Seq25_V]EQC46234.1 ABC transporter, substrate-binding protein, family 3 [Bacteriovorax sp. Seq25_V]